MLLTPDAGVLCDSKDIVKYAWTTACARPMQPPLPATGGGADAHALARGLYPQVMSHEVVMMHATIP